MKMIIDFAQKHNMLPRGARVLCAVSGGADSMCLLHFLASNAEKLGITVTAAHFNHRLRGEEADRDQQFVEQWCRANGITCIVGSSDVKAFADKNGLGIEEAAREKRYEFLEKTAEKHGCTAIATAHNSDDNAETMLLNLARGSGAKGLCAIPPVRDKLIRPLLNTTRAEIEAYLAENGVPHIEDSSNAHDDYTRNVLRHKVMPVLRDINPSFTAAVSRTAELLRADEECLGKMAQSFVSEHFSNNSLPAEELKRLPYAVSSRVLRLICGRSLTAQQTEAVLGLLGSEGLAHTDIHGMRVTHDCGRLYFGQRTDKLPDTVLAEGVQTQLSDFGLTIETEKLVSCKEVFKSFNIFHFNYESICGTISLTSRREGDKIRLSGRNCTKSLKDLFSEAKMPQSERNLTPVLRDEKGVIAVYGFGIAQRCIAQKGDTVLRITINKTNSTGDNLQNEK